MFVNVVVVIALATALVGIVAAVMALRGVSRGESEAEAIGREAARLAGLDYDSACDGCRMPLVLGWRIPVCPDCAAMELRRRGIDPEEALRRWERGEAAP